MMEFFQKIEVQVAILVALFGVIGFAFKHYFARAQKQSLHFQEPPPPENALVHQENTLKRIGEICFDYLPISPLERGWKWDYVDTNRKPFFSLAKISPVPGCLKVETEKPYCIKYQIEDEIFQNCKRVKVCIKLRAEEDTMFWTQVAVSTKDNSKWNKVWIKYYKGNKPSEKYESSDEDAWVIWMPGRQLENDWTLFDIDLPEAVESTWGKEGWMLKHLTAIAIRGNIQFLRLIFIKMKFDLSMIPALLAAQPQLAWRRGTRIFTKTNAPSWIVRLTRSCMSFTA